MSDTYRIAASMLLLRPSTAGPFPYDLLLLHKPRKKDAWQLPQGGVEGEESPEQCARRELKEEAGITNVALLGVSKEVYQYDFPSSYRRFRPDHICGQRILYVFALVEGDTPVQVDGREINQYMWIQPSELPKYVKRRAYLELVQRLLAEVMPLLPA